MMHNGGEATRMTVKKLAVVAGALAIIAVIGAILVGTVFAQTATPPSQTTPNILKGPVWGPGLDLWGGGSTATFDAAAKALNLTPTQLFDQLHSGKTLAEVAQAQGVDLQTVQNAITAARTQAMKDAINQAVQNGRMTQAQADWLIQGLDNGYLGKGIAGFGFDHFGFMGRGGMRSFPGRAPMRIPRNTPTPGTTS
jgi:hypothetical protein